MIDGLGSEKGLLSLRNLKETQKRPILAIIISDIPISKTGPEMRRHFRSISGEGTSQKTVMNCAFYEC